MEAESNASYSLLKESVAPPIPSSSPDPSTSPILVCDACGDICLPFIGAVRSSFPFCPITAYVPFVSVLRSSDEAELKAMGVALQRGPDPLFASQDKRRLIKRHPRVLLYSSFRFRVMVKRGQNGNYWYPEGARSHRDEVLDFIAACHDEKAEHVTYVSTASPNLFREALAPTLPLETVHVEAEKRLREGKGVRHWTILRPVTLMSLWTPSRVPCGREDPYSVLARFDPEQKQQFIAPADVGRIAARVLTDGEAWYGKVLDLAGPSRLSPREEVEVRNDGLQGWKAERAKCDVSAWEGYNKRHWFFGPSSNWWILLAAPLRRYVTQDVARALLGTEPQDYRTWFITRVRNMKEQPPELKWKQECAVQ